MTRRESIYLPTEDNSKRVLLISNSTLYGGGYLDHAESEIRDFLGEVKQVLFVPYALYDRDAYASTARERFKQMGYDLTSIHTRLIQSRLLMRRTQFSSAAAIHSDC
jgi:peptidase E